MEKYQFLLSSSVIPSILVILSWLHNNTRLSRLESGQDALNRRMDALSGRMDDQVRGFHADMISFQASILESNFQLRERIVAVETRLAG